MQKRRNIKVNDRFTRLTVVEVISVGRLRCLCDCGNVVVLYRNALLVGHDKSCGCMHQEVLARGKRPTHGGSVGQSATGKISSEYAAWRSMKARTQRETDGSFKHYGARGIKVCERWLESFENFIADMGYKPSPEYTLERRDVDGNYSPENCYWATRITQGRNKRNNLRITIGSETLCLVEWSERSGVQASTLQRRYYAGWPPDKFLLPAKPGQKIMPMPKRGRASVTTTQTL